MSISEHVAWVKKRALAELNAGVPESKACSNAMSSLISDIGKEPAYTGTHAIRTLAGMLMMGGHLSTRAEVQKFIEDLN